MKDKYAVSMFGQKQLSREGGIEIVVKELCTRMARDDFDVYLAYSLRPQTPKNYKDFLDNCKYVYSVYNC